MNLPGAHFIVRAVSKIFLVILLAAGCEAHRGHVGNLGPPAVQAVLDGDVVGPSGEPIAGALVSVSSHFDLQTTDPAYDEHSDARGHFRFAALPVGRYGITVTHADHMAAYGGVIQVPRTESLRIVLRMGGVGAVIEGTIRDEHEKPIAGARVQAPALSENEHEVYVTHADARGHYRLTLPTQYGFFVVADVPPRPRAHTRVEPKSQVIDLRLDAPAAPRPSDSAIAEWLRSSATPLSGERDMNEAGSRAISGIVGDAPVVALGEATHGSAEFPEWRRRVFQALVRDKGFTVYAVETGWAEAFALDDYVVHGRGDVRAAIRALGAWKDETKETLALASWMREYNADPAHSNKVHFAGFDVLTVNTVPEFLAYLRKVDPPAVSQAEKAVAPLTGIQADLTYPALPKEQQEKVRGEINALVAQLDANRATYITRSNETEWARARQLARVIQQAELSFRDYSIRDDYMFENFQWLVDHSPPGTKFVLDAHNAHIAAGGHSLVHMGRLLREKWGKRYVSIGFAFGEGSLYALDWREKPSNTKGDFSIGRAPKGTFDGDLSIAGIDAFVVDLRLAPRPIDAWLRSQQRMHHIGGRFLGPDRAFEAYVPARDFDAVIYVDKVSAIHPLERE